MRCPVTSYDARRQPVDAIDEITVQFEEASAIRLLIAEDDPASRELACRWAQEWVDRLAAQNHPQPLLRARRLLAACLAAAGRGDEAKRTMATIAAQCAQLGMFRFLARQRTLRDGHARGAAGGSRGWPVAPGVAGCSSRFPGSTGQCRGGATDLTDARPPKLAGGLTSGCPCRPS